MSVNRNQLQKGITMPVKRAASSPKQKPKSSESKANEKPANVRDETHGTPEVETRKTTAAEAKQIDNDPGYSAEQLDQMAGYYGTGKQTAGEVVHITALGRDEDDEES